MLPLALALILLLLLPSAATADWSEAFDVSTSGSTRRDARVAVAPSGAAVVAWLARDGAAAVLQARRMEPDGTRGPILDLSPAGRIPAQPDVAMDADGHATVVWSERGTSGAEEIVRARRITAAGALEPAVDLTGPGLTAKLPDVEVAPSGAVTVTWLRTPAGTVHLRRIDPVGGLGGTVDVTPPDSGQSDVAVGADGDAYVTWVTYDGADQLVHGRRVEAGGDLGDIDTLSDDEWLSFGPRVGLDAAGTPTVTWIRENDSIELRRGLGATVEVAPAGVGDTLGDLAVDADGNATVVWTGPSGSSRATFLRRVPATGAPGPVTDLWSGGSDHGVRLALDGAGTPTLIWGNETAAGQAIKVRTAPAGAPFGPVAELWPASTVYGAEPSIASNGGEMTAVWRRGDHTEEAIVAARFTPAAPPPAQSSFAPPATTAPPAVETAAGAVASCRVPKLKRLTLAKARKRLKRAGCRVAAVKRPRGSRRKGQRLVVKRARLGSGGVRLTLVWRPRAGGA
jgi:hypothetical protein